jgi:phosphoglycolate phosphatase
MKKLVIFDLDGTLVDAYPAIIKSARMTLEHFGYSPRSDRAIRRAVGWGDRSLLGAFIEPRDLDPALAFYRRAHAKALRRGVRWLPFALAALRALKKSKIKIAIASNRPTKFTRIILRILAGEKYFDAVLCADRLKFGKPHPLILNLLIKRLGVPKRDVLFVGDMVIDVETGQRAKVDVAAVATGSSSYAELKALRPKRVMRNLRDLIKGI